jgi:hypothetical protein
MTSMISTTAMTHPLTPLYLQPSANLLSPATRCRLAFVAEFGPCSLDVLRGQFCADATRRERDAFRSFLFNLVKAGYLQVSGRQAERRWQIGYDAKADVADWADVAEPALAPAARAFAGLRTPAAQYNIFASTYRPTADPALRPGALDFKRLPSHGYGC